MMHYDAILKAYADNGFRSAAEWQTLGRAVADGAEPRSVTTHLPEPLPLYTRAQTQPRPSQRRRGPKPAAAQPAAPETAAPAETAQVTQ
jgi:hypothetical protein